jgi:uncharacterized protein (DUF1501 family)
MACNDAAQAQAQRMGHITRRGFLRFGGLTLAALAAADTLSWVLPEGVAMAAAPSEQAGGRRLVVLELNGGNDGLNTLIPYTTGRYYDMRARLGVEQARVLQLDKAWGLHPSLARMHARAKAGQVTFVHGVGVEKAAADLSHFSMQALWRAGDAQAAVSGAAGWAGRLVTSLGQAAAPVGGLSIASAPSPLILDADARTAAAADAYQGQFAFPDGQAGALRQALSAMARPDPADASLLGVARHGLDGTFAIHDMCASLGDPTNGYPATDLGRALAFTAQLLTSQPGLRVVHVPVPLDFDTHDGQLRRQAANLAAIDVALEAFMLDLQGRGLARSTAVLAVSEFGRRVEENGSLGTDHGGANTLFVVAPGLRAPIVGTPPALERLDDDGNLAPTMSYRDYLASAIEGWMGVPAAAVLPGSQPLKLWS